VGRKTYNIQNLKQYRMSQVITELTLIIELKRHIELSFENRTQNIMTYSKRKRRKKEKKK
jgi:hypothetical protein